SFAFDRGAGYFHDVTNYFLDAYPTSCPTSSRWIFPPGGDFAPYDSGGLGIFSRTSLQHAARISRK
ncbi:MAG: hypothetical protein VB980_00380, partial [Opitutales bacterium]